MFTIIEKKNENIRWFLYNCKRRKWVKRYNSVEPVFTYWINKTIDLNQLKVDQFYIIF